MRGGAKPTWKKIWDQARHLARSNELEQAKKMYDDLLEEKPYIVEALWEYSKLLIRLREWDAAAQTIEELLELEPNGLEYLVTAGQVALENGHFSKAVKYFGQVYEREPTGAFSERAIAGMIEGFKALGKQHSAFLLLEQYYQRKPENSDLLVELARFSSTLGRPDRERYYYAKLVQRFGDNKEYLSKAAQAFDAPGYRQQAAGYWRRYLDLEPDHLPFHRRLADYYIESSQHGAALPHLIAIYRGERLAPSLALQIADIYNYRMGRPDKALFYYEQYLNIFPKSILVLEKCVRIRDVLARQYLPIVENDGEQQLWRDLELITQHREDIFLRMADLLHEQNRVREETAVLEILWSHHRDLSLAYRLAKRYRESNKVDDAYTLLQVLQKHSYANKDFLLDKAAIERQRQQEEKALHSLVAFLQADGGNVAVAEEAVELAGALGLRSELTKIWSLIPDHLHYSKNTMQLGLAYAEALRLNGLFSQTESVYKKLLAEAGNDKEALVDVYFHMADTQLERENVFDAERIVRQVLARNLDADRAIEKLAELSLREGRTALARSWLMLLIDRRHKEEFDEIEKKLPPQSHFLLVAINLAEKEFAEAEDLLLGHPLYIQEKADSDFVSQTRLYLVRSAYLQQDYKRCLQLLDQEKWQPPYGDEQYVLRELARQRMGSSGYAREQLPAEDSLVAFTSLLQRGVLYRRYGGFHQSLQALERALAMVPDSLRAAKEKVHTLDDLARYDEALAMVEKLNELTSEQRYFDKLHLQLEFKSGKFQKIVEKVELEEEPPLQSPERITQPDDDLQQARPDDDFHYWKKLLLARALWAQNRREESLQVYESLLAVPVDTMFLERVEVENINFPLPPLKKSFWNRLPFIEPKEPDHIATVMDPHFVAKNIGHPIDDIAASMYGKYRWQKLVEKELSARQAVKHRDYYRAEKEYLDLLQEEASQESLFDLAAVYDKLGLYGKAAELYEIMKDKGPLYPGLDEYIQANILKRQPRIAAVFLHDVKKGRDGYYNLKKGTYGVEGWLMPSYDQEISISFNRNTYSSHDTTGEYDSDTIIGTYSTYFENLIDLNVSFGVDRPTASGENEILYKFELIRRLDKSLEVYGRFEQDLVEDTLRSVTDSVIYRDMEAGLKYDIFPRWFAGADYRYRMYSDDNQQHRYKLWTTYHLFGEMNQFKVKYSYEHIRNNDENVGREEDNFRNIFRADDRVYWSPEQYWQHLFTVHFKHFFEIKRQPDDPLSYCSFDYSFGYEEDYLLSHEFDVNIFLEIDRHFLLKGNLNNQNGEDYKETRAGFSLIYRW